jgi:putative proteasome-type protease
MTFCVGMKVHEGLVGIADTRITSGAECITARKLSVFQHAGHSLFVMTSGLRSVRDKVITYFEEVLEESPTEFDRLHKAVNALAAQTRRTADEDKEALEASKFSFNFHALVGGQMKHDREHKLYLLYPQGNWVEVGPGTPYCIIGETGYGKPILDRTLKYTDTMQLALKVGALAFDSTRISSTTVDFPLDVVLFETGAREMTICRYEKAELADSAQWWQERLRASLNELPSQWVDKAFVQLEHHDKQTIPMSKAEG